MKFIGSHYCNINMHSCIVKALLHGGECELMTRQLMGGAIVLHSFPNSHFHVLQIGLNAQEKYNTKLQANHAGKQFPIIFLPANCGYPPSDTH